MMFYLFQYAVVSVLYIQSINSLPTKEYLSKIDCLIYEKLTNPVIGEGDPILDSIQIYNKELNDTIQAYLFNKTGQDVVDMLIEQRGPKCVKLYPNDHVLRVKFDWGVKELGELYYYLNIAKSLWREFHDDLICKFGYQIEPIPEFYTSTDLPTTTVNKGDD